MNNTMAKIEIELSEIEDLKRQIEALTNRNQKLEGELAAFSERHLVDKAIRVAESAFESLVLETFKSLGFDNENEMGKRATNSYGNLHRFLSDSMRGIPGKGTLVVEPSVTFRDNMRLALLNIGYKIEYNEDKSILESY